MAYQFKELKLPHANNWVYESTIETDPDLCRTQRIGTEEKTLYARLATLGTEGWRVSQLVAASSATNSSKTEHYRLYLLQRDV